MRILFVSDVHLDAGRPDIARQFLEFLAGRAATAQALYILGDLFESWVGDDGADASQLQVIEALAALTAHGTACFVMHGNRDFLLRTEFCRRSGARLLTDPTILHIFGQRLLLMHGDALCTDDVSYQRLRATVRDAAWQRQVLDLTLAARRVIARAAREGSRAHTSASGYEITDVNPGSVEKIFRASGIDIIVHGHTHRPGVHTYTVDGRACQRIVLGDWYSQGSVLEWSSWGYRLESLTRGGPSENETVGRAS